MKLSTQTQFEEDLKKKTTPLRKEQIFQFIDQQFSTNSKDSVRTYESWKEENIPQEPMEDETPSYEVDKEELSASEIAKSIRNQHDRSQTTVSIALPGSILLKQKQSVLQTYLASEIARAAGIFTVDEVVIYNEENSGVELDYFVKVKEQRKNRECTDDVNVLLGNLIYYMETPPYLRREAFNTIEDFRDVGAMNPLNTPNHLTKYSVSTYHDVVVTGFNTSTNGTEEYKIMDPPKELRNKGRAFLKLATPTEGKVTTKIQARQETGKYFGFEVRLAGSFQEIWESCPFGEYDVSIGTSDKGDSFEEHQNSLKPYKHLLIVFGSPDDGLRKACNYDPEDDDAEKNNPRQYFSNFLNMLPNQGSRTIRTEEAIFITLSRLAPYIS